MHLNYVKSVTIVPKSNLYLRPPVRRTRPTHTLSATTTLST